MTDTMTTRQAAAIAQAEAAERINTRLGESGLWTREHTNGNHTVWRAAHDPEMTMVISACDEYLMTTEYCGTTTRHHFGIGRD